MVKISAALAWYDEPVEFLDRCVRSLAGVVDDVVALDGAWEWMPGAGVCSPPEQYQAIVDAAEAVGLPLWIGGPEHGEPYESQVTKRADLMEIAGDGADWIFVIDGDEYVTYCDSQHVRAALDETEMLTAAVSITNLHRGDTIPGYHPRGGLLRRFYRSGTTVVIVHSGYSYLGKHLLAGEPTLNLQLHLRMEHDNCNRGRERNQRAIDYRDARQREGVEVWT